jgi:hypothetical protein
MRLRLASAMVVRGDRGEAQEATERPTVVEQVSDRPAHSGGGLEGASVPVAPPEQPSEERPRALAAKRQVLRRTDDAGVLRVAFHDVDLADEVERLLRFRMLALLVDLSPCMGDTSGSNAAAGPRDRVVAGVLVDDETSGRVAEDLLRSVTTAVERILRFPARWRHPLSLTVRRGRSAGRFCRAAGASGVCWPTRERRRLAQPCARDRGFE